MVYGIVGHQGEKTTILPHEGKYWHPFVNVGVDTRRPAVLPKRALPLAKAQRHRFGIRCGTARDIEQTKVESP